MFGVHQSIYFTHSLTRSVLVIFFPRVVWHLLCCRSKCSTLGKAFKFLFRVLVFVAAAWWRKNKSAIQVMNLYLSTVERRICFLCEWNKPQSRTENRQLTSIGLKLLLTSAFGSWMCLNMKCVNIGCIGTGSDKILWLFVRVPAQMHNWIGHDLDSCASAPVCIAWVIKIYITFTNPEQRAHLQPRIMIWANEHRL